jgi:hypothetical protein
VLGAWCLVLGAWCLVFGAWCLVLGVVEEVTRVSGNAKKPFAFTVQIPNRVYLLAANNEVW